MECSRRAAFGGAVQCNADETFHGCGKPYSIRFGLGTVFVHKFKRLLEAQVDFRFVFCNVMLNVHFTSLFIHLSTLLVRTDSSVRVFDICRLSSQASFVITSRTCNIY